jgi:hypothetical protein
MPASGKSMLYLDGRFVFFYRLTAAFEDGSRSVSEILRLQTPDSTGDFVPIRAGDERIYSFTAASNDYGGSASDRDSGEISFRVLQERDSGGLKAYAIAYREDLLHEEKTYIGEGRYDTVRVRQTLDSLFACVDSGSVVTCPGAAGRMAVPFAGPHRAGKPAEVLWSAGLAQVVANFSGRIHVAGIGMIGESFQDYKGHQGWGSMHDARLTRWNGNLVDFGGLVERGLGLPSP